ncbi:hypothetical protein K503DRAFT_110328 [Rhizopogon vinicolor AM-OR11-026]|uniref:Uncharacterized protein n=1 Tax=Rhizopogon vinicolor AM-OR11-026 TaxID=1314800 RepID=A0A1B7MF27_9AGAM|nr:hypothetical protein K503DRAFT_110328 [Rhizopogon vinicolor AM-OR11-026]
MPPGVRAINTVLRSNSGLHTLRCIIVCEWTRSKIILSWACITTYTLMTMREEPHVTFASFLPKEGSLPPAWISGFHSMRLSSLSFAAGGSSGGGASAPVWSTCPPLPLLLFCSVVR